MDIFLLYLFTRVDNFIAAASIIWILGGIIAFLCLVFAPILMSCSDEIKELIPRIKKPFFWVFGICLFISLMVPTKKELAIIVGGHLAIEASQSDTAKKVYAIVQDLLDQQLAEIAKKKAK